ncbi:hypothetical protein DFH29DRAFT_1081186 [Suillus ampliporus]|nr:hypothetical protein DFH29DRAFT_1081186 [Suillus ampliporus]
MPATSRKRSSRARSESKPYERRVAISHSSSPALSDDQNGDERPPSPVLNTADKLGFPTYAQYKRIETAYLESLSPRKRDKALICQSMFDKIWDVLHQPDACTVGTPQFRFWVRKMFTLSTPDADSDDDDSEAPAVILHENRPVAVQEQLYELFCYCHEESNHGGRDKTCAIIRQHYSWVPKELTAQFVKACPTCIFKRSGNPDLIALIQEKISPHEVKEEKVEESRDSLCRPDSPEKGWRFTGGPHDQPSMPINQTVDVALSLDTTHGSPSTPSPSVYLRGAPSKLFLRPRPPLLHSPPESRQTLVDFSRRGLHPLTLDITGLCIHSNAKPGDLPSLADAYWDNTKDDQLTPPELQRLQMSSPGCTQHVHRNQIDPVLLTGEETIGEREGCMGEVSPLSPYSTLAYSVSPNLGYPSPLTPADQLRHSLYEDWTPPRLEIGPAPSQLRFGSMSAYLTPVVNSTASSRSVPGSQIHILPVTISPPLSPLITPFTSASPTPAEEGEFGEGLLRGK